ncbi:histidine kinase [Bifidobacterium lemurum]|uniref:Sensor-like histidine kinase SenX3 n=1 Tax=Bifidobacterium lemurum TaxID=1603886 RepID=A0A261FV24_9BIFI|nr:ATP-binding protein [Bifidobacterium lemurum]OZG63037.1 histidine kinase [Bifidobacterium lemurum]QOL35425.1 ATP-binding protein [Bifidobacterium lemurum]
MQWWQIALPALAAVAVLAVAVALAYMRGRDAGERDARSRYAGGGAAGLIRPIGSTGAGSSQNADASLFGGDLPVRAAEEGFIQVMTDAVIIADAHGFVHYASADAMPLGLVEASRLVSPEVGDILAQVVSDGETREREVRMPIDHAAVESAEPSSGRGVKAGQSAPSHTRYLNVRVGAIAPARYAILLSDMSEQRRFEAMRRDFVTNVSHELKTPAGAIALLAETIADAADDPDAVRYFSGRISKESERLTELVHRLIDLQKAQDDTALPTAQRLSVLAVAREAIAENRVQAAAKHIDVRLSCAGKPVSTDAGIAGEDLRSAEPTGAAEPTDGAELADIARDSTDLAQGMAAPDASQDVLVNADEESLTTAVKNLIENAIRYSPEHTTVNVAVSEQGGTATIRVIDQGIGIPQASLGRIFERFYRVDPARSRATGGTGLGLAIVKHCVQDCGGTITVWSREGEGSTFTIELPSAEAAGSQDTQERAK